LAGTPWWWNAAHPAIVPYNRIISRYNALWLKIVIYRMLMTKHRVQTAAVVKNKDL
jgi:hypothetical protein